MAGYSSSVVSQRWCCCAADCSDQLRQHQASAVKGHENGNMTRHVAIPSCLLWICKNKHQICVVTSNHSKYIQTMPSPHGKVPEKFCCWIVWSCGHSEGTQTLLKSHRQLWDVTALTLCSDETPEWQATQLSSVTLASCLSWAHPWQIVLSFVVDALRADGWYKRS